MTFDTTEYLGLITYFIRPIQIYNDILNISKSSTFDLTLIYIRRLSDSQ